MAFPVALRSVLPGNYVLCVVHPENSFGFAIHQDTEILQYLENLLNIPVIDAVWVVAVCQLECLNPLPLPALKPHFNPLSLNPPPSPTFKHHSNLPSPPPLTLLPPHLNPPSPLPFAPVMTDFGQSVFAHRVLPANFGESVFGQKLVLSVLAILGQSVCGQSVFGQSVLGQSILMLCVLLECHSIVPRRRRQSGDEHHASRLGPSSACGTRWRRLEIIADRLPPFGGAQVLLTQMELGTGSAVEGAHLP